jgi:tetratricopeptide (TPR) repeat protein
LRIVFPFNRRTAAAAFERAGILTLVFNTPEPLSFPGLPPEAEPFARLRDVAREGTFAVVRFTLPRKQVARLSPQGQGWVLTLGEGSPVPVEPLPVNRSADESGRMAITVLLADSSGVYWLDDVPGSERVAVVTAFGPPRGLLKSHRFVEFSLLPTLQGLAVAALADDVVVRASMDGVTVSRAAGLSLSPSGLVEESIRVTPKVEPVIRRDPWLQAQAGSVLGRWRELLREAADAPPWQRSQKRLDLAGLLLANGLYPESAGVLAHAVEENRTLLEQRPVLLLRGIAALGMRRFREAKDLLSAPVLGEDPEGILWRASLDAAQERWPQALEGFRHAEPVLEFYPESLQAELRLQAARAAIETRDFVFADKELAAAGPVVSGPGYDKLMFLHARLDQSLGRADLALDAFRILSERAARPLAARATLAYVDLALANDAISPDDAIARLETLAVIWRGDEVEAATLGQLGRLYAKVGRWREAFLIARRANVLFPDSEIARGLHNETARLFEDLFLSGKGDSLSKVDSLALFFDFQEFTPIGRRGDEIVRRLADRLVSLDLLEQAGALLQHQVDNRLYGAARATVAARLATVRLMDGKPALALEALRSTRLPELPQSVNRARLLLEARALSDLSRTDLALEILDGEKGPEIDRLRADILWSGQRWREAGEAHESLVGTRWRGDAPLEAQDRNDLLRAAIAYSLADDAIALDRLRAKFSAKMADSIDARTFDFLTQPNVSSTRAFRDMARRVTSADTLADFLAEYRKRYPDAAAAEPPRRPGLQEPQAQPPQKPQAQEAAATPPNG